MGPLGVPRLALPVHGRPDPAGALIRPGLSPGRRPCPAGAVARAGAASARTRVTGACHRAGRRYAVITLA
ncbi:hypothetical protein GCM10010398_20410 [Streptomyces fimbriatus]